jgi:WD40 repeat protein
VDVRRHGKEPAAGTPTSDVRVWDVAAGRLLSQFAHPARRGLAFLPDGKTLFAGGDNGWGEGAVHFLDVTTGQEVRRFDGHDTRVEAVAFSPDGRLVATGAADGSGPIRLWESATGKPVRALGGQTRGARDFVLAFSPVGNTLAAGGYAGRVTLWDVAAGEAVRGFRPHRHNVLCLVFSADGKTLTTSASYDSTVCVTGVATGKEVRNFRVMKERIWGVVLSPDAALAACDSQDDDMVYLWDVTAGKELRRVSRQASGSISLAFSADGRTLATQDGRTVRLWEVATGLERRSLRLPGLTAAVAFSPGGRLLAWAGASANNDKFTVNLLDLASGKPLRAWAGHQSYIGALAFSPDGRRLASVSADTTGLLWATPPPGEARLKRAEREAAWRDLGEIDAAKAYTAVLALASDPEGTAPFLKEQLRLAAAALPERFTRLVADLDSDRFEVRAKAKEELAQLGPGAEPLLRKALERPPSPEARKALRELLGRLEAGQLRDLRAVEALETLGTPPARELLQELSRGETGARLTREAQASLRRLARRPAGQK